MSFDKIFDLTAGVYFHFLHQVICNTRDRSITHSLQRLVSTQHSISQLESILIFKTIIITKTLWDTNPRFQIVMLSLLPFYKIYRLYIQDVRCGFDEFRVSTHILKLLVGTCNIYSVWVKILMGILMGGVLFFYK